MTGEAFTLRVALAQLMRRHRVAAAPFTPSPLLAPVNEGLAAPATVERMKFGARCWMPFASEIPLLVKCDCTRTAGKVLEVRSTDQGLYVRCVVSDSEAKRCSFFTLNAPSAKPKLSRPGWLGSWL